MLFPSLFILLSFIFELSFCISSQAAGVQRNLTIDNHDPHIRFSSGWTIGAFSGAIGGDFALADGLGDELQIILPANATTLYYVGFRSALGTKFAVCLDCNVQDSRQFLAVDARDPSDDGTQPPEILFSLTGLNPTVPHVLVIANLWDDQTGQSQLTFDALLVTVLEDGIASSTNPVSFTSAILPTSTVSRTSTGVGSGGTNIGMSTSTSGQGSGTDSTVVSATATATIVIGHGSSTISVSLASSSVFSGSSSQSGFFTGGSLTTAQTVIRSSTLSTTPAISTVLPSISSGSASQVFSLPTATNTFSAPSAGSSILSSTPTPSEKTVDIPSTSATDNAPSQRPLSIPTTPSPGPTAPSHSSSVQTTAPSGSSSASLSTLSPNGSGTLGPGIPSTSSGNTFDHSSGSLSSTSNSPSVTSASVSASVTITPAPSSSASLSTLISSQSAASLTSSVLSHTSSNTDSASNPSSSATSSSSSATSSSSSATSSSSSATSSSSPSSSAANSLSQSSTLSKSLIAVVAVLSSLAVLSILFGLLMLLLRIRKQMRTKAAIGNPGTVEYDAGLITPYLTPPSASEAYRNSYTTRNFSSEAPPLTPPPRPRNPYANTVRPTTPIEAQGSHLDPIAFSPPPPIPSRNPMRESTRTSAWVSRSPRTPGPP